ncbi:MAG: hypothetical protein JEY94_03475 [Melioribacteraceae bacterium]|nr:hypothetical protein [Melioribacteraceae bacterium]
MKSLTRSIFLLMFLVFAFSCSDDDNPSTTENGPEAISGSVSWEVNNTDINHTIAVQLKINPTFDGESLSNGDKIGVFCKVDNDYVCAGFSVWTGSENIAVTAWGDDSQTTEKDGFSANETFVWRIQRAADQKNYAASVEYESGPENFIANGITVLKTLKVE